MGVMYQEKDTYFIKQCKRENVYIDKDLKCSINFDLKNDQFMKVVRTKKY